MDYFPCIAAIAVCAIQIFCNNSLKEHLKRDHPEVSERDYYPSNIYLYILLIAEVLYLVTSIIKGVSGD